VHVPSVASARHPPATQVVALNLLNRAIREGYERVHREVVVLPEEYTGANVFNRVADLTYDAQFYFLQADLLERNAPPVAWADAFQRFLHDQQQTLPPGALKLRWISNHDTVSWTFQKQRPAEAYGVERMRALLALCGFIDGVPMLYQGDEDPAVYGGKGESSVDFLARIYALRKQLPALREGSADYASVRGTDGVFACLRTKGHETALVLISFDPASVESALALPADWFGAWLDRLTGESMTLRPTTRVAMKPFQIQVLTR
jgi:glycosidase